MVYFLHTAEGITNYVLLEYTLSLLCFYYILNKTLKMLTYQKYTGGKRSSLAVTPTNEALMHNYCNAHTPLHRRVFINSETAKSAVKPCARTAFLLWFVLFSYCGNI